MQPPCKRNSEPNGTKAADQTTARATQRGVEAGVPHGGPSKEQGPAGTLLAAKFNPFGTHPGRGQPTTATACYSHRKMTAAIFFKQMAQTPAPLPFPIQFQSNLLSSFAASSSYQQPARKCRSIISPCRDTARFKRPNDSLVYPPYT